jgi:hypothetical protein
MSDKLSKDTLRSIQILYEALSQVILVYLNGAQINETHPEDVSEVLGQSVASLGAHIVAMISDVTGQTPRSIYETVTDDIEERLSELLMEDVSDGHLPH